MRSIRKKAARNKVTLRFGVGPTVHIDNDDIEGTAGYFSVDELGRTELAVAIGNPFDKWIQILLHESSHMDQEFDKTLSPEIKQRWNSAVEQFFGWLIKKTLLNKKQLDSVVNSIIELEKDCEERTVAKIKKFNLPIDIEIYTQKANVYLYTYTMMKESRRWTNQLSSTKDIYKKAPKQFQVDYNNIPRPLYTEFQKILNSTVKEQ